MKRLSRRLAALLMAMVMVLAMGVTSFAQETPNKNVNVHFVSRDATVANPTNSNILTVNVTVSADDTIQEVVNAALEQREIDFELPCTATWSGDATAQYLDGITIDGVAYNNTYSYTPEGDQTRYTGTSWMWNYDGGSNYPEYYMNQTTIGDHGSVYLIYEKSSFVF